MFAPPSGRGYSSLFLSMSTLLSRNIPYSQMELVRRAATIKYGSARGSRHSGMQKILPIVVGSVEVCLQHVHLEYFVEVLSMPSSVRQLMTNK
jgi:hypothetical protein